MGAPGVPEQVKCLKDLSSRTVGHAGATANLKPTFHLDHSPRAD